MGLTLSKPHTATAAFIYDDGWRLITTGLQSSILVLKIRSRPHLAPGGVLITLQSGAQVVVPRFDIDAAQTAAANPGATATGL